MSGSRADIFLFSPTPASRGLTGLASEMLSGAIAPYAPREIHEYKNARRGRGHPVDPEPKFIHHPECKRLIPQIMSEHGVDLEKLYKDVPRCAQRIRRISSRLASPTPSIGTGTRGTRRRCASSTGR